MRRLRVAVIDGKGGGLGRSIVEVLAPLAGERFSLVVLGTNAQATRAMMAAGASDGATGENAICYMAGKMDVIVGPMAILVGNAMMGEVTPAMAAAVSSSPAQKLLLPLARCGIRVVGTENVTWKELLSQLPRELTELLDKAETGDMEW